MRNVSDVSLANIIGEYIDISQKAWICGWKPFENVWEMRSLFQQYIQNWSDSVVVKQIFYLSTYINIHIKMTKKRFK
jgi:hypothetical protein